MKKMPPTRALPRVRGEKARLIIDASERDSDLLYASGFMAGDPFTYVEFDGASHLILSDLEFGRGKKESTVDSIASYSELEKQVQESRDGDEGGTPAIEDVVIQFLRNSGIQHLMVPARFPVRYADRLRQEGFVIDVEEDPFYPCRQVKSDQEIEYISAAQQDTEAAMLEAIDLIRGSEERDGILHLDGEPLTVERVKRHIRAELLRRDYLIGDPIVAPGDQGCDPHNTGAGEIRAGDSIIIDIFPRHMATCYWGDMTRTVVKGEASAELIRIHEAVARAQQVAFDAIRPGVTGAEVHAQVQESFKSDGFVSEQKNGTWCGFFHGTGHGLGLDIHERPRLGKTGGALEPGMVVTVEPGLYYPGIGGVRIEDVVVITEHGNRSLNRAPRDLVV